MTTKTNTLDTLRLAFNRIDTIHYAEHTYDGHQWHKTPGVLQVGRPQDTAYWNPLDKGFKVQLGDNRTIYAVEYTPGGVEVSLTWDGEEPGRRRFHTDNYRNENALAVDVISYIRDLLAQY